jgi:hypothetical protein
VAQSIRCPHCLVTIDGTTNQHFLGDDRSLVGWVLRTRLCPACGRFIFFLAYGLSQYVSPDQAGWIGLNEQGQTLVYPHASGRTPCPPEVPAEIAEDYTEACLVLTDSPKASAALSRRCLQHLLRSKAGVKQGNLADEIQQVLDSKQLPSHLAENIDAIRNIGNFAAHPNKSTASGEILDVEPGEAEWNLDVLEGLFDHYYVGPAKMQSRREALNKKLKEAGKPLMK